MGMTLLPVHKLMLPEALPLATSTWFTFTFAVLSATVGVIVIAVTSQATLALYSKVFGLKTGLRLPLFILSPLKVALVDTTRVMVRE